MILRQLAESTRIAPDELSYHVVLLPGLLAVD